MTESWRVYFITGLPISGSTLLANTLVQNSQFYVTPTSGIVNIPHSIP